MTEIISKLEDVSKGFINIYVVLDNDLQRSDIFVPFLNTMLKLQACLSIADNSNNDVAINKALNNLLEVEKSLDMVKESKLIEPALTDSMLQECEALRALLENYISVA
ncbi:MAG: hypothetical protein FWD38_10620 [Oscillospiraceae bacterium]|nr:hypothetical protein [Oscillospiraceae bacterium]